MVVQYKTIFFHCLFHCCSITSLYNKFLTPEAQKYIRETSGFAEYDISAAVQVVDYPPSNEEAEVLTVTKGFQSIPTTLLERFLNESRRLVV